MNKVLATAAVFSMFALTGCTPTEQAPAVYAGHCDELVGAGAATYKINNFLAVSGGYGRLSATDRKNLVKDAGYASINEYLMTAKDGEVALGDAWSDEAVTEPDKTELMNLMVAVDRYKSHFYEAGYDIDTVLSDIGAAIKVISDKCTLAK